eukprot:TRINITY_DN15405_c0_g1_i1.p1 TRINITY_DN15405_c0_g1~~TRINITY_DN15405_c0_g1_i1.p1  ORF type:complete len:509 (+),score=86.97 TRINITY_DN15405_c0_g1_i1:18-1544(+)
MGNNQGSVGGATYDTEVIINNSESRGVVKIGILNAFQVFDQHKDSTEMRNECLKFIGEHFITITQGVDEHTNDKNLQLIKQDMQKKLKLNWCSLSSEALIEILKCDTLVVGDELEILLLLRDWCGHHINLYLKKQQNLIDQKAFSQSSNASLKGAAPPSGSWIRTNKKTTSNPASPRLQISPRTQPSSSSTTPLTSPRSNLDSLKITNAGSGSSSPAKSIIQEEDYLGPKENNTLSLSESGGGSSSDSPELKLDPFVETTLDTDLDILSFLEVTHFSQPITPVFEMKFQSLKSILPHFLPYIRFPHVPLDALYPFTSSPLLLQLVPKSYILPALRVHALSLPLPSPRQYYAFFWDSVRHGQNLEIRNYGKAVKRINDSKWYSIAMGNKPFKSGCHNWSILVKSDDCYIGVMRASSIVGGMDNYLGSNGDGWAYVYTGYKKYYGRAYKYGEGFGRGDVIGVRLECDKGWLSFSKNGVELGVAYTDLIPGFEYYPAIGFRKGQNIIVRQG